MKNGEDIFNEFQQSLEGLKGHFHVLDTIIPVEKQMEYFNYSEKIRKDFVSDEIENQIIILNSEASSLDEKKYAMTFLAISGDVKAYRILEVYAQGRHADLEDWSKMAFMQAQITLESEFSDEKHIFISTGLGGKGDKLRFYSLFKSTGLIPFTHYQVQLIEKEIPFYIHEYHGEVEEIEVHENYFCVMFLINLQVNIKNMLISILEECNQYGNFISRSFVVTNVRKYNEEEIKQELYKS